MKKISSFFYFPYLQIFLPRMHFLVLLLIHLKRHHCRCTVLLAEFNLLIILDSGSAALSLDYANLRVKRPVRISMNTSLNNGKQHDTGHKLLTLLDLGADRSSWLPYSSYLYLDFNLFHDKAKRTQQGQDKVNYAVSEREDRSTDLKMLQGWRAVMGCTCFQLGCNWAATGDPDDLGGPRSYMQKTCDVAEMAILAKKNCGKSA